MLDFCNVTRNKEDKRNYFTLQIVYCKSQYFFVIRFGNCCSLINFLPMDLKILSSCLQTRLEVCRTEKSVG